MKRFEMQMEYNLDYTQVNSAQRFLTEISDIARTLRLTLTKKNSQSNDSAYLKITITDDGFSFLSPLKENLFDRLTKKIISEFEAEIAPKTGHAYDGTGVNVNGTIPKLAPEIGDHKIVSIKTLDEANKNIAEKKYKSPHLEENTADLSLEGKKKPAEVHRLNKSLAMQVLRSKRLDRAESDQRETPEGNAIVSSEEKNSASRSPKKVVS